MSKVVGALYGEPKAAYEAIVDLLSSGFERESISILSNNISAEHTAPVGIKEENMLEGSVPGILVGGLAGSVLGLAALAIPGIGPVLAAGPLLAAFIGGTTGLVAGGLIGTFLDWEIQDSEAEFFAEGVRRGGTLIIVKAEGEVADCARAILNRYEPVQMSERVGLWRQKGWTHFDSKAKPYTSVQIAEERAKNRQDLADKPVGVSEVLGRDDPSLMPGKLPGMPRFEDRESLFRKHYSTTFAQSGYDFSYYLPAYLFGYNLANDDRYADKDWAVIEPNLGRFWDEYNPGMWDQVKEAVHFARDTARGKL